MVQDFLKLCCGFAASMCGKIGFPSHINGVQIRPVVKATSRQTEFIRSSALETVNRLLRIRMDKRQLGAKGRKVIELYIRVFNKPFFETLYESLGLCVLPIPRCQPESIIDVASARRRHCNPCLFWSFGSIAKQAFAQSRHGLVGCRSFLLSRPLRRIRSLP